MYRVVLLLDNRSLIQVRSLLKGYYEKATGLAPKAIERREFGFGDFDRKIAYRHYAFGSEKELRTYLVSNAPPFVSFSSAEYEKPGARPMENKKLIGSSLVFDLDSNDLNLPCKNEHGSAWVCRKCFEGVKNETIELIEKFLIPDFGFSENEISVNFSGNRGYHVHVSNEAVFGLDGNARKQIADYVSGRGIDLGAFFPALGQRGVRLDGPKPTDYGWGGKLANGIINALNSGESSLLALGIDKKSVNMLVRKRADIIFGITTGNWDKVNIPKKAEFWENVLKGISIKQSESIDRGVVNDIYHLIRLPGTIHGDTGLVAMKVGSIKALDRYDPMTEAIAFKEGAMKVRTLKVPKFTMNGTEYGPFDNSEVELPTYAGVYMVLKRLASVV
jgi:DNA primase small subunit